MPRPLRDPQTSSSVARLFDPDAAARALAAPVNAEPQPPPVAVHRDYPTPVSDVVADLPQCKREIVLTESTAQTLDRLVQLYRTGTRTRVTTSHVVRAVLVGIAHAFDALEREARGLGPDKRPSNAHHRAHEREQFERRLAAVFVAGMRATSSMPSSS